ncbi:hypothetical protein NMY22_g13319 [Coprinellus aureogranulatus]|nr:hypothetical protein NMY22_g13319 [Coprinellus aureogranulatus]
MSLVTTYVAAGKLTATHKRSRRPPYLTSSGDVPPAAGHKKMLASGRAAGSKLNSRESRRPSTPGPRAVVDISFLLSKPVDLKLWKNTATSRRKATATPKPAPLHSLAQCTTIMDTLRSIFGSRGRLDDPLFLDRYNLAMREVGLAVSSSARKMFDMSRLCVEVGQIARIPSQHYLERKDRTRRKSSDNLCSFSSLSLERWLALQHRQRKSINTIIAGGDKHEAQFDPALFMAERTPTTPPAFLSGFAMFTEKRIEWGMQNKLFPIITRSRLFLMPPDTSGTVGLRGSMFWEWTSCHIAGSGLLYSTRGVYTTIVSTDTITPPASIPGLSLNRNPAAPGDARRCPSDSTRTMRRFLEIKVNTSFSRRWRYVGIMLAFIAFLRIE